MTEFNERVIEEFRANAGVVSGFSKVLLLHHVGAKSGTERIAPLAYLADGDRYIIFGSKAGAPTHPAWYHNLLANPDVSIEVGVETIDVHAEELTGDERDRIYNIQAMAVPQFAEYAAKTDRVIPVIALVRR